MIDDFEVPERPDQPLERPFGVGGVWYVVMALGCGIALAVVLLGRWRLGLAGMGAAFAVGAVARALISQDHIGILQVRRRSLDVVTLLVFAAGLITLAFVIPPSAD